MHMAIDGCRGCFQFDLAYYLLVMGRYICAVTNACDVFHDHDCTMYIRPFQSLNRPKYWQNTVLFSEYLGVIIVYFLIKRKPWPTSVFSLFISCDTFLLPVISLYNALKNLTYQVKMLPCRHRKLLCRFVALLTFNKTEEGTYFHIPIFPALFFIMKEQIILFL